MNTTIQTFFLFLLATLLPCQSSTVNRGYIFTAPSRLLAEETESACLSLHNLEPPANVVLELLSPSSVQEEEILTNTSTIIQTGVETCVELAVPAVKYSNARLRLKIKFDKYPDYVVETEKDVYIEHDSLITFVETDKPVYKPGQDVNIRVLMLKHDFKPWKRVIPKVWIENPSQVRVAQWMNVSTDQGLAQLKFTLSAEPSPGNWEVKVEKKKSHQQLIQTTVFEVKKYVLPRFQVTVASPEYILADADNVTWNICAKYSYGKPVKGTLLLKSTPQTPSWRRKQNLPEIHYETELDSPDGCTEFVLSGAVLGLPHWKVAPNNIVLIANFTEAGTGVVETTISRTIVVHQALKLEFVPYTPKYFKLGLPYHGKLRVLRHNDTPAPNEKIQLCLKVRGKGEWLRVVVECRNFTSSSNGFVDFIVPPPHKNIVLLSFVATGIDYPTKYYSPDIRWRVFMDQPSAYIDVNPWYSPSDSYLAVARGLQPIVCGEKYSFNVMYTVLAGNHTEEPISFHYSINSKGDLLIFGHVTHKPHRDTVLNYSEFRNLLGSIESPTNKTDQGYVVHRFPLSVKITPSMAPVSELLLYYVRPDGETVATTYTIEVGHCFENKVKTAWHSDVQNPGSASQYHVEAAPWSVCGISAVDKSTLFLAKSNLVNGDQAFDQLKRFHPSSESRPIWPWSHCKVTQPDFQPEEFDHLPVPALEHPAPPVWDFRRRRRSVKYFGGINYVDATQAFDDFGVIVISDLTLETRPCPQIDYPQNRRLLFGVPPPPDMLLPMPRAFPLLNFPDSSASMGPEELQYVDQFAQTPAPALRSYFPETWLWELVPTGKEGKITIERNLPHTITDWVGHTVCISPKHGLGIAPPTTITAFQSFFLDYNLPYSVKRGELLRMKVSLFNYLEHSLPIKIKLEDATGLDLHLSHPTASFCVKPRDSVVHEYILRPRILGEVNITVSAAVDPEYTEPCGPETLVFNRDLIVKPILVQPEGFPVDVTKSAFICPKDFSDDSVITWSLDLPKDLVPDSARAYVSLIGDILGPALENLENLVRLPMGCGEQNMILFVPNIHVIGYLESTGVENLELKSRAIKNMEKGYQRELNYRHPDGSYSAFGPSSETESSIWLTAFVVKSFAQARSIIHIDERDLKLSVKWLMKKQLENGCFPVVGRVFHKEMKGGLQEDDSSSPALTAYILVSLLESGVTLTPSLINNALYCLEKGMASLDDSPYTLALSTYSLALLEHPRANGSMKLLMDRATRNHDLLWWEDKSKPSMSLSIEMTAYAVLSLVKLGGEENLVRALKAVRWMSKQRNAEGGFVSTQDTVLGLEALTKYAIAMSTNNTDLSVLVTAGEVDQVYRMYMDNKMVLTQIQLPALPTIVEIFAEGEGCVLVQTNLKYNVAHVTGSEAFDLSVAVSSMPYVDECSMQTLTICGRYKMADEESNMALLEVSMISGYVPDRASLHSLLENPATRVKRFEEDKNIVTIYFDKLISQKTCISFVVTRENVVDRLEPANVKLYDYYQQELVISSNYKFAETCSSADPSDDHHVPNPMPVEVKLVKDTSDVSTEKPKEIMDNNRTVIVERHASPDKASARNVIDENSSDKATERAAAMAEKLRGKAGIRKLKNKERSDASFGTVMKAKDDEASYVESSDPKINRDDLEPGINIRTGNDNSILVDPSEDLLVDLGSGQSPKEHDMNLNPIFVKLDTGTNTPDGFEKLPPSKATDEPAFGNPEFVIVDHELETPDGVEGPPPVYANPDSDLAKTPFFDVIDYKPISDPLDNSTSTTILPADGKPFETNLDSERTDITGSSSKDKTGSCPTCKDKLPDEISRVYCPASSVVKVAIRRLRKARLLLDLQASNDIKRLRSTIELVLNPDCSCPPLDNPGSLALLVDSGGSDFIPIEDHSKKILDRSISVYSLPNKGGVPSEILAARESCPPPETPNAPAGG
ncbi:alpha-2-macroglobulin-like protein 1 isoform X2 [Prorops nasuta]|uniref:alpha-2-macroglobulin-like protein 1 isoform X2 n=1 Tax=Prorops nasuta TaxID=863751 RepID=UPI0034CE26AB